MAEIQVCLPGKCTAIVSVTPLKVKHLVGHADHSKEAATTLVADVEEHAGVLYVNLHVPYACVMQLFLSHLKSSWLHSPGNISNMSTCLPGRHTATVCVDNTT